MCRLTVNDILNVNVSKWELGLVIITVIRIAALFVLGGLSLKMMSVSQMLTVGIISHLCTVISE